MYYKVYQNEVNSLKNYAILKSRSYLFIILSLLDKYHTDSNKHPGGVAIFQKGGDVYKRQVFNAKMQCLSLFTMTRRREI